MTKHGLSTSVDNALAAAGALKTYTMVAGTLQVKKPGGGSYYLSMAEAGTPDRVAFIPRRYWTGGAEYTAITPIYIEIKDKADKLHDTQVARIVELLALGFEVYVCSADVDITPAAQRVVDAGAIWCVGADALHQALVADIIEV